MVICQRTGLLTQNPVHVFIRKVKIREQIAPVRRALNSRNLPVKISSCLNFEAAQPEIWVTISREDLKWTLQVKFVRVELQVQLQLSEKKSFTVSVTHTHRTACRKKFYEMWREKNKQTYAVI